jgi:hypothetical protein
MKRLAFIGVGKMGLFGRARNCETKQDSEIVDALSDMSFRVSSQNFEQNVGLFFSDPTKNLYQNISKIIYSKLHLYFNQKLICILNKPKKLMMHNSIK